MSTEQIRKRVIRVREIQSERYAGLGIETNAQLGISQIEEFCALNRKEKEMMYQAYEKMGLSARSYHKVLCVARTIADMEEKKAIGIQHLQEALSYRTMQFKEWRR